MDLIVTMDDATNTIYSAFLTPEEGTASTFQALLEVFGRHGLPLSLYTDRGSHYFYTPEAGGASTIPSFLSCDFNAVWRPPSDRTPASPS
jgi:hypothetical protein